MCNVINKRIVMTISTIHQSNSEYHLQALSPAAQEDKEKKAIAALLEGTEITEIYKMPVVHDDNRSEYIVYTNSDYFIRVYVLYDSERTIGPVKFTLLVNDPELKKEYYTGLVDDGRRNPLPVPISVDDLPEPLEVFK